VIDIQVISRVGFNRLHTKAETKGIEVFSTSLYKIDHILEVKTSQRNNRDPKISEIKQTLPRQYHDLTDVFSKKKSDKLPPYRSGIDHDIILKA
jgi:hypothetical protein